MLVPELLSRCTFAAPGTAISCAVSGGADSLALLVLAVHAGCEVTAIHVDHGLRDGSAGEADVVRDAAARLGARFVARQVTLAPGPNLEARAREARYAVLPPDVCTGHTADDQAETVVLALLRGSGLAGVAAMAPGPQRPLLGLRRAETAGLCVELGLRPVADAMNDDPRFGRVRVRQEVLPLFDDIADRDVVPLLARHARLAANAVAALDAAVAHIDATDVAGLRTLDPALAAWALRGWIQGQTAASYPVDVAGIERVMEVVRGTYRAAEVVGGWRVVRSAGRLRVEPIGPVTGAGTDEATR